MFRYSRFRWSKLKKLGSSVINEIKTFSSRSLPLTGDRTGKLTLGHMLRSNHYWPVIKIDPIVQLVGFVRALQACEYSLDRLNEIHDKKNRAKLKNNTSESLRLHECLCQKSSYRYIGAMKWVLDGISLNDSREQVDG